MRRPRAERVTTVHRIFLAAQWPEVHYPPSEQHWEKRKRLLHSLTADAVFRKTRWYKKTSGEHNRATGLVNAPCNNGWQATKLTGRCVENQVVQAVKDRAGRIERETRNEYRPFRRQLRPHTSRTPGTGRGRRQSLRSAAGAVCGGECSSAQTESAAHRVHPSLRHGGAGDARRTEIRAVAAGGARVGNCGASLRWTVGGGRLYVGCSYVWRR